MEINVRVCVLFDGIAEYGRNIILPIPPFPGMYLQLLIGEGQKHQFIVQYVGYNEEAKLWVDVVPDPAWDETPNFTHRLKHLLRLSNEWS